MSKNDHTFVIYFVDKVLLKVTVCFIWSSETGKSGNETRLRLIQP